MYTNIYIYTLYIFRSVILTNSRNTIIKQYIIYNKENDIFINVICFSFLFYIPRSRLSHIGWMS